MSDALKKKKTRIGEIGDLCGIPASTGKISLVHLPIVTEVDLFVKKLSVYLSMYSRMPLTLRLCSSRGCDT